MGQDKALLPWGDSTFLKTVAGQMDFLDEKYLSVAANDISSADGLSEDWIRLPDLFPDRGPLGGIYTALASCRAQWALVASCDIPAVERRLFTMLLENRTEEADIIYPLTPDGRMHMTCALYRKTIAPVILAQIEKGDNRLRILSDLCRSKEILIDQPDYLRMLSNINTGAELDTIRKSRN
jgi:molybdopterin-guanine dinucleotide biosynthesis protein A